VILVDDRVGSRELLAGLRGLGCDADLAGRLDADFQFTGCGPDGTLLVGIERKEIQDLLNSKRDHRLAGHQLGPMTDAYDRVYLVVEGYWRRGRGTGLIETRNGDWRTARGRVSYAEIVHFLSRLEEHGGIRVFRTGDEEETVGLIAGLYSEWQEDYRERLRKVQVVYAPGPDTREKKGHRPSVFRRKPTLKELWVHSLPGIEGRSIDIAKHFTSARDVAESDVARWLGIKGLRIGKKTAETIVEAIGAQV